MFSWGLPRAATAKKWTENQSISLLIVTFQLCGLYGRGAEGAYRGIEGTA